jgi:hypothetical protein
MVITSVRFPHKDIHKETWMSPDGHTRNQIDHVIIDARHDSDIIDVRSYTGADCDSHNCLVKIKYRPKITVANRSTGIRSMKYNTEKVKDINVSQEYKWTIKQQLGNQPLQDNDDIEERWKNIKQSIHTAAEEVGDDTP